MKKKVIHELHELKKEAPEIFGIKTGTLLDRMFYKVEIEGERAIKKPLGGIPYQSIINLTGIPDTGKSVLGEQFAVYQAGHGYPVAFVTVESPARFLYNSFKQKALALSLDFETVDKNIIIVDATEDEELRESPTKLMDVIKEAIKRKNTKTVIIDSITGLYEHREVMARQIVRKFFNFLKKWKQTALFISQKRSSQSQETAEAAGGLAVAHILDGTIVMDKKIISSRWEEKLYRVPIGTTLRTIRIDGCRLTPHETDTYVFDINDLGIIEIKGKLSDLIGGVISWR